MQFDPPLELGHLDFVQVWRAGTQDDPARRWLRERLQDAVQVNKRDQVFV